MAENELNKDKRNRSAEWEKDERSMRSESTNLETGTTPKANVNTSSFGGAGTRGEKGGNDSGEEEGGGAGDGTLPNANTGTQRGSVEGSNVASGTGVRRETGSTDRGTSPGQRVENPKTGGQPGSSMTGAGASTEQQRQRFNEGQGGQQGSRRTSERPEGRPEERRKREEQV